MKKKIIIITLLITLPILSGFLDPVYDLNEDGNKAFQKKDLDDAYGYYERALEIKNKHPKILYNMANTLYKANNYSEANIKLRQAMENLDYLEDQEAGQKLKQKILYNTGNTFFKMGDMDNAIKYYEQALELKPDDEDARFNLELAKKMKEMQKKQQQQQQKKQQEKEKNNKQNKSGGNQNQQKENQKQKQNNSGSQDQNKPASNERDQDQTGQNNPTSQAKKDKQDHSISENKIKNLLNQYKRVERNSAKNYFQRNPKQEKNLFDMTTDELLRQMQEEMGMIESNNSSDKKDW